MPTTRVLITAEVPQTILAQLGGKRFAVMTGAKGFAGWDDGLSFALPGKPGYVSKGINTVRITLTWRDTYTVEFSRVRQGVCTKVETLEDVYAENLQEVFTRVTGLYTRL